MTEPTETTRILTALRDPCHGGHLNSAAATEIARLRIIFTEQCKITDELRSKLWVMEHKMAKLPIQAMNGETEAMMDAHDSSLLSNGKLHPTVWWAMRDRLVGFYGEVP
jgi:hypothetical protein